MEYAYDKINTVHAKCFQIHPNIISQKTVANDSVHTFETLLEINNDCYMTDLCIICADAM